MINSIVNKLISGKLDGKSALEVLENTVSTDQVRHRHDKPLRYKPPRHIVKISSHTPKTLKNE
jgi:hypothetical protein